ICKRRSDVYLTPNGFFLLTVPLYLPYTTAEKDVALRILTSPSLRVPYLSHLYVIIPERFRLSVQPRNQWIMWKHTRLPIRNFKWMTGTELSNWENIPCILEKPGTISRIRAKTNKRMSILDLSKTLMYNFHYNYIKPKYGNNANLLFTDTDSLCYEIKTEDFYNDITPDVEKWFDTSNYDKNHSSGIPVGKNKKVVGMMKDECGGEQISEFVGLRSKLYAYKMDEGEEEKKCKGVKKNFHPDLLPSKVVP
ncbi:Hypothetical predicted protein, partial [Paramuricea clavata]